MSRRFKLGLLLGAGLLGAAAALFALNRLDEGPPAPAAPAPAPDQALARGAYLARVGNCMGCHTQRGGTPYAGGRAIATPFGSVFAPNLTPDKNQGLGSWSADDFWRALHNGRSRDGRLLSPAFPYNNYSLLSRADADALYAYLRTLPASEQPNRAHELRFPYNTQLALAAWRALYFRPAVYRADANQSAQWNRGAYLSQGLAHCNACHAPRNSLGAVASADDFSGGMLDALGWYAPSLHDPQEGSVAGWSPQALRQWLKSGRNEHASALGPMGEVILGSTQYLSEPDLDAMLLYLQTLPQHPARPSQARPAEPTLRAQGARLYDRHCASCHGDKGQGAPGAYPALAGNRVVTMATPANLLRVIQRGGFAPATAGNPRPYGMPPFAGVLDDGELAALASYLRSAWGNQAQGASDVRPMDVLQLKSQRVD
ncbi:mono/diheme cytochrome c family protein [Paucibacter oligotrophus]|uniref:Mono/diheme cytochrome c family protein n=1 Tax=Roseateles oligotrophus TaxID=1769250 RepID=A0A840LCR5_9BURK|nr:c-type cytochrome [Roseateles oligotrophus]MBB4844705.1 mono/diheme cytochrome c family protein [Roseateles oligotrophus]